MGKKANKKKVAEVAALFEQAPQAVEEPAKELGNDNTASSTKPESLGEPGPIIEEIVDTPPQIQHTNAPQVFSSTSTDPPKITEGVKLDMAVPESTTAGASLGPARTTTPKAATVEEAKEEPTLIEVPQVPVPLSKPQLWQAPTPVSQSSQMLNPGSQLPQASVPTPLPPHTSVQSSLPPQMPTLMSEPHETLAAGPQPPQAPVVAPTEPTFQQPAATHRSSSTDSSKRRSDINAGAAWKALGTRSHAQDETSSTKSYRSSSTTTDAEFLAETRERDLLRNSRLQDAIQNPPPPPAPSVPPSPMTRFTQPFPDARPTPRIPDHSHRYYPETVGQHNPPPSYYNQRHYGPPMQSGQPTPPYQSTHSYSPMEGSYRDSMGSGSRGNVHDDFMHRPPPAPAQLLLEGGDEATKIIGQLSSTIPEIQRLMARYHETQGKLGEREERIREAEAKQEIILRQQDEKLRDQYEYIYSLRRDLDSARSLHAADSDKFRHELGNFQDQQKGLQDRIREAEVKGKDLEGAKAQSEAQIAALEREKQSLDKAIPEERLRLMKEFDEWKTKAKEEADAQHMAIATALVDKERDHEAELAKKLDEMKRLHDSNTQQLEEQFAKTKTELEAQVTVLRGELDDSIRREGELSTQHDTLKKSTADHQSKLGDWEAERTKMRQDWEGEHAQAKSGWDKEREQLAQQNSELTKNLATTLQGRDQDKARIETLVAELRRVSETLGSEKERLQKLLTASVTTDLKSKGDAFYKDAFNTLCRLILQLATSLSDSCQTPLPADITATITTGLPPHLIAMFQTNPTFSRTARIVYTAHTISTILTRRIFTPFLFSLPPPASPAPDAHTLLTSLSSHIHAKSAKKESIWRQTTLAAAFQCAGAKAQINRAAGSVVEDILGALNGLTAPEQRAEIGAAVKNIVKGAAQTWRLARLERDLVTAWMPECGSGFAGVGFDDGGDGEGVDLCAPRGEGEGVQGTVVLGMFPEIRRARPPVEMCVGDGDEADEGCVYSVGMALCEEEDRESGFDSVVPETVGSKVTAIDKPGEGGDGHMLSLKSEGTKGIGGMVEGTDGSTAPYSRMLSPVEAGEKEKEDADEKMALPKGDPASDPKPAPGLSGKSPASSISASAKSNGLNSGISGAKDSASDKSKPEETQMEQKKGNNSEAGKSLPNEKEMETDKTTSEAAESPSERRQVDPSNAKVPELVNQEAKIQTEGDNRPRDSMREHPKPEEPKAGEPKAEAPNTEDHNAEVSKAGAAKAEVPISTHPKSESRKAEEPKVEDPRVAQQGAEEAKAGDPKQEDPNEQEAELEEPPEASSPEDEAPPSPIAYINLARNYPPSPSHISLIPSNPFQTPTPSQAPAPITPQMTRSTTSPPEKMHSEQAPSEKAPSRSSSTRARTHRSISATYGAGIPGSKATSKSKTRQNTSLTRMSSHQEPRTVTVSTSSIPSLSDGMIRGKAGGGNSGGRFRCDDWHAAVRGLYDPYPDDKGRGRRE